MRAVVLMLALLVLLASSSRALAQDGCEEGRERVDGRCCWPGQTFSVERARCEGAPRCPAALTEHGEMCIARATSGFVLPPPPTDGSAPTTSTSDALGGPQLGLGPQLGIPEAYGGVATEEWPTHGEDRPWRAAHVRGEDEGLITSALSVFDFGYVLGWIVGWVDLGTRQCSSGSGFGSTNCNSWPLALIPFGGGIASGLANFGGSFRGGSATAFIVGIPSAVLQVAGLIGAIVAFSNSTDEIGFQPIGDPHGVSLAFVPSAPSAEAGGSLDLRF